MATERGNSVTVRNLPGGTMMAAAAPAPRECAGVTSLSSARSASRRPSCRPPERRPGGDGRRPPPPASPLRSLRAPRAWRAAACALAASVALWLGAGVAAAQGASVTKAEIKTNAFGISDRVVLTFDRNLDSGSTPAGSAFQVISEYAGVRRHVSRNSAVTISGRTVTVALSLAVRVSASFRVTYTKPSSNPLRTTGGVEVEDFTYDRRTGGGTNSYRIECSEFGYWHVTNKGTIGYGDYTIPCDMAEPAWFYDQRPGRLGYIIWVYEGAPGRWANPLPPRPPVNQPLANGDPYDAFLYVADADNRAVRGTDGNHYREQRVRGQWQRSISYGSDEAAGRNASWNAYNRSQGRPMVNPRSSLFTPAGTFPSGAPPVPATLESATVDGTTLTLTFDQNLDTGSKPAPGAFRVTVNNARRGVASGGVAIAGKTVTLTLTSAVAEDQTVKVRYTRPTTNPLRGANGLVVDTFADQAVSNGTDALGKLVSNVDVGLAATATLNLMDPGIAWAQPFTTGSAIGGYKLTDVQLGLSRESTGSEPSYSVSIRSSSSGNPGTSLGTLTKPASLPTSYELLRFTASGSGISLAASTTYFVVVENDAESSRLSVAVTDSNAVDPNRAPGWDIGNSSRLRTSGSWNSRDVSFLLALHWGFTEGASGNSGPATAQANIGPASVSGVEVVSDSGSDNTYGIGDTIEVQVTFDRTVEVTGTPRLKIDMDPADWGEKWASYESGSGTGSLTFAHTVVEPNFSPQGIAVLANSLELNGGTVRAGGADAALAHTGLAHDADHKVDWQTQPESAGPAGASGPGGASGNGGDSGPPTVTGVAVVSDPGADDTYMLGDTIRIRATFSAAVNVTGSPRLSIDMDPAAWGEKQAAYASGSGTGSLTFAYAVVEPNFSPQGIAVLANSLALNGGTIRSAATNANAALAHTGLGHASGHKVDWRPEVSVADARATEGTDANVVFTVSLSRAFTTAEHSVRVDYATADGTAKAGADYTATSGTLTFAAGETVKTVNVPVLDDTVDEGSETFSLRLSNAAGARIGDGEATGTITNDDPLQKLWLSRFGRTVAGHVTDAVSGRLAGPLSGAALSVGGQRLELARTGDDAALARALTGLARVLGASEAPAPGDGPGGLGARGGWPGTGLGRLESAVRDDAPARRLSGRALLRGSAFHLAREGDGGGPGFAAWGRVTVGGFDGEAPGAAGSTVVVSRFSGIEGRRFFSH